MDTDTTEVITTCARRTFANGKSTRRFRVDDDGTVSAWDDVAGHFTSCHSLTARQMASIRQEARQ